MNISDIKELKFKSIKFAPIVGFGFWKDVYKKELVGLQGYTYNFVIPFIRMQFGILKIEKPSNGIIHEA